MALPFLFISLAKFDIVSFHRAKKRQVYSTVER
jgi:hypothetical protein